MTTIDDILSLIRPNIAKLAPYRCARDDFDSGILLDANENSFGSMVNSDLELHRYPDPHHAELCRAYSGFRGVQANQLFFGVGSDEAIDNIIRIFCEPGKDSILITPPTYGMYKVSANIHNAAIQEVPLTPEFQLNVDGILDAVHENTRIIFLCSPNNPTGNVLNREDVLRVIQNFNGVVVVDEAYIDFCADSTFAKDIDQHPNLVVMQTLSKAFGLAAIRLGAAIAHPSVIRFMRSIKAPYNLNKFTLKAGLDALAQQEKLQQTVQQIITERDWLSGQLQKLKTVRNVFPSDANFILIRMDNALQIYHEIPRRGVVIRYRGDQKHCESTLRITVGTRQENEKLLELLAELENSVS